MRGWSSFIAGFLLLGLGYWLYSLGGFGSEALICGVAAAAFILQGAFGQGLGAGDGATGLLDFIQNPADAIVDSATDKLADWLQDDDPQAAAAPAAAAPAATPPAAAPPIIVQPHEVVAEGAMDRYFAQREAELAASAAQAPARGFGRKGL